MIKEILIKFKDNKIFRTTDLTKLQYLEFLRYVNGIINIYKSKYGLEFDEDNELWHEELDKLQLEHKELVL
jgi:Zn-dependent oligopeptidase